MKQIIFIVFLLISLVTYSQATQKYTGDYEGFYRAEELFAKRQFSMAKMEFETFVGKVKTTTDPFHVKSRYYIGVCALEMNSDVEAVRLFMQFNKDFPENIYKNQISFRLGNFYFKNENKKAREWYSKVIPSELQTEQKDEFYFKYGYTFLLLKEPAKARSTFMNSKESKTDFGYSSKYYYATLLFNEDKKSMVVFNEFQDLIVAGKFLDQAYNYQIQIKHQLPNFQECISLFSAPDKIKYLTVENRFLIGDAHYQLKEYQQAIPYFEYFDSTMRVQKTRNLDRDFNYSFGNAYYETGKLDKAISKFNFVLTTPDSLSQLTYYKIATIFKEQFEKTKEDKHLINARTAFEKASDMVFDVAVQEDALYNAAVLAFNVDDSPYYESVEIFEKFIKLFPNSERKNDIYQYLVEVYRRTNNFDLALTTIESIDKKDSRLKTMYQTIAFNYGVTLFQRNEFDNAISKFKLVDKYPMEMGLKSQAKFWMAESKLRHFESLPIKALKDSLMLDESIDAFRNYLKDPSGSPTEMRHEAYYHLGYIYLKQHNLSESIEMFRIYVKSGTTEKKKLLDAYLRVGDSYYMTRKDEEAIKYYQDALDLKEGSEDLAMYYMSKSNGFLEKNDKKIELLLNLINNHKKSKYMLSALYDLALAYKDDKGDYTNALNYFKKILSDYPKASFYLDCQIEVADIYYLKNDYAKAEAEYQRILDANLTNNAICLKAATGLKNVYTAQSQTDKIAGLIDKYPCAQISTEEIENLYFEPADKAYEDSLFVAAIPKFETYLSKFPNGRYATEALYFLGDCYGRNANNPKKVEVFKQLLAFPVNTYSESAAAFVSQQAYNSGEYEQAIKYYLDLEKVSTKPSSLYAGRLGVMRSSFLLQKYDTAAVYSKLILESGNLSNSVRVEAEYSKGISNFKMANYVEALPSLSWITKNTTTSWASEAQYVIAEIYYIQLDYTKSDSEVRLLLKMKPAYNFWIAKSLILQSRICIKQENLFQAEQTIESVLSHYPDKEDGIVDEATAVKQEIDTLKNGGN
jgi:tetratricopeptide (TPR) repeat protein